MYNLFLDNYIKGNHLNCRGMIHKVLIYNQLKILAALISIYLDNT